MSTEIQVQVAEVKELTPLIKFYRFKRTDGQKLKGFDAGAHISVKIPAHDGRAEAWRSYSLIHTDSANSSTLPQDEYLLAIRREDEGQGGSLYLHNKVKTGDVLAIREPTNDFPLTANDDNIILFAGGIGVTPIAAMASELLLKGKKFEFHYSCRSQDQVAFEAELRGLLGDKLHMHLDDGANALDLKALLGSTEKNRPIYICGPKGMIDATFDIAKSFGWSDASLHSELFTAAGPVDGDQPFEVELAKAGKKFTVRADQTLLDALIENGHEPLYDCRQGFCGLCEVEVVSGQIDHRDSYLLPGDQASGKIIQACVSRATGTLVLNI